MRPRIIAVLRIKGEATATEIAAILGISRQTVATTLTWMRGAGEVKDNKSSVYLGGGLWGHTAPTSPVRWSLP